MKIVYFTHSLISCWNHGNAHFLRGVTTALLGLGHQVMVYEPAASWSRDSLVADQGNRAIAHFAAQCPELAAITIILPATNEALGTALDGADLVLVHEWNEPALFAAIGTRRARGASFTLLFHDTHHRMVSDLNAMHAYDLSNYDGILAFGATLSEAYRRQGWGRRVFTWHEAADITRFHPPAIAPTREGAIWIGNWGDNERSQELDDYLFDPIAALGITLDVHGVRYPDAAKAELARRGVRYHGWIANADAPAAFAGHQLTVHVPRRFYVEALPGIPTIRVFEALACGIPLLSAPWDDCEGLFTIGEDFLMARNPADMHRLMRDVVGDAGLRQSLAAHGRATIEARHSCLHRAHELIAIAETVRGIKTEKEAA